MNETYATLLRALLKAGGGALVAKGMIDESAVETITAALVTLIGVGWGIYAAKRKQAEVAK